MGARTKGRYLSLTGVLLLVCCTVSVISKGKSCVRVSVSPGWKRFYPACYRSIPAVPPSWLRTTCHGSVVFANIFGIKYLFPNVNLFLFFVFFCKCAFSVSSAGFWFTPGLLELSHTVTAKFPSLFHLLHVMLIVPLSLRPRSL